MIALAWEAPVDGGSEILDYQLWYDNASGSTWIVQKSDLTSLNYIVTGLEQGSTYNFKIEARNAYGHSFFSNVLTVLAA